jgi:predicted transcriptional regulator
MSDNNYEKTADIIFGRWKSQILYTGVKLGIFDCLTSHVKSTSDIANELGLNDKLAYRLLRALSSMGLLKEEPHRRGFSITLQGELLRKDHPQTLRGVKSPILLLGFNLGNQKAYFVLRPGHPERLLLV